jgi:hypothetical protein
MATQALPKPDQARNLRLIGHSDQGGRPDGVQLMVHRGHAYVAATCSPRDSASSMCATRAIRFP